MIQFMTLEFQGYLSNYHNTINFTMEYSRDRVNFLDITVYRSDNRMTCGLYSKPTDARNYLHRDSFHTKSTIERITRICTTKK